MGWSSWSSLPRPAPARQYTVRLNENAGINGVRHLVHVFDIAECIAAVWWQPPSSFTASAMDPPRWRRARRAAPASSVRSRKRMFCGGFYKQQSRLFRNFKPIAAAIFAASRPTQSRLTVLFRARRYFSATPIAVAAPALGQFHRMLAFHQTHQFIGYAITTISTFSSAQMMLLSKEAP